jgi:DGQHR domain-containing protein
MTNNKITFDCIEVAQPIGTFYIASIPYKDLIEITKIDIRKLAGERGFETYLGIQRPRNEKRVQEIAAYISTRDACFPTAVILSVKGQNAEYDKSKNRLSLFEYIDKEDEKNNIPFNEIASVLDGQHRIEGLKASSYEGEFNINVSIFIDIDIADQAYLFSTINLAQTKVNKSLVFDLFELAKNRSPQKTCHNIAVALDREAESPFYKNIKRLGKATEGRFNETITQATFIQSLLQYISDDPVKDRDVYMRGKKLKHKNADELNKLIFANMFIEEKDLEIADIVWNYFDAVKIKWPKSWSNYGQGNMLNKTNGFKALMRFLRPAYLYLGNPGEVIKKEQFVSLFGKIHLSDNSFTTDIYHPGTAGESKLYTDLILKSGIK